MKFACPKCKTRYTIAEERVPTDKILRFACKKCGNAIRLRRKAPEGAPDKAPVDTAPDSVEATRVANLNEINKLRDSSASAPVEMGAAAVKTTKKAPAKPPPSPFESEEEWYVLIAGKQHGPLSENAVVKMLNNGEVEKRTYAWRDGLGDWKRLSDIDEFEETGGKWRSAAQAPTPVPPPPPADESSSTVAMDISQLQGELQKIHADAIADENKAATPGAGDADMIAALTGEPTGEGMSRKPAEPSGMDAAFPGTSLDPKGLDAITAAAIGLQDLAPALPGPTDAAYLDAPPGESTRVFMVTAGIFQRRRRQRIAAIVGISSTALLATIIGLDIGGIWTIPGMGIVYDVTGMEDPNLDRAIERVEEKLAESDIDEAERKALRDKLLGLGADTSTKKVKRVARAKTETEETEGVKDTQELDAEQRDFAASVFASKKDTELKLADPSDMQTPNLPEGLTAEAIYKVIADNNRSMNLCFSEAMRKGENLSGKMEIEMTITPKGSVSEAQIMSDQFKRSTMGTCTLKRIKTWKFPRFNGEPVPVIFPYVLSAGF